MSKLSDALQEKIGVLETEKEALEEKIALLRELLSDEDPSSATPKRKPGRPRGSKKKTAVSKKTAPMDAGVLEEASRMEGTDPEIAARLSSRKFNPAPRPVVGSPGIRAGSRSDVGPDKHNDNAHRVGGEE